MSVRYCVICVLTVVAFMFFVDRFDQGAKVFANSGTPGEYVHTDEQYTETTTEITSELTEDESGYFEGFYKSSTEMGREETEGAAEYTAAGVRAEIRYEQRIRGQ